MTAITNGAAASSAPKMIPRSVLSGVLMGIGVAGCIDETVFHAELTRVLRNLSVIAVRHTPEDGDP